MALVPPFDGIIRVTAPFGEERQSTQHGTLYRHRGVDYALQDEDVNRAPVRAPDSGSVLATWTTSQPNNGYPFGNALAMRDDVGRLWRFLHLAEQPTVTGAVTQSQILGLVGSTGNSTGPHLHVDVTLNGSIDAGTFYTTGQRVDPHQVYADGAAWEAGYDTRVFRKQIAVASGGNVWARRDGNEGIAQIDPTLHPDMAGRTTDPIASIEYTASVMGEYLVARDGDYREALADWSVGPEMTGARRIPGYAYANQVLESQSPSVMPVTSPPLPSLTKMAAIQAASPSSTPARYKRVALVTIETEAGQRIVIEDLRIAFEIRREAQPDQAPAKLELYNLTERTAGRIEIGNALQVHGGYKGKVALIYAGEVAHIEQKRQGVDRIVTLTLGESMSREGTSAICSKSYKGAVNIKTAVLDIALAMGLGVGDTHLIPSLQIENYVCQGKAADALTKLLRPHGIEWYTENGVLHYSSLGVTTGAAHVISENTGMIGSPTLKERGVRALAVLNPHIQRGQRARIESELVRGEYKVIAVTHRGDTWGDEWHTEIDARVIADE